MGKALRKIVESLCPDIDERTREDFFSRMDPEYFSLYPPEEIVVHLRMSSHLDHEHPVQLRVTPREKRIFEIVVVAFDYFSEFSILCGLMASFGLDIHSGNIYTFSDGRSSAPKKIVDLFRVRLMEGEAFHESRQKEFERELQDLILLLDRNQIQEARERVNRHVVEYLSRRKGSSIGLLLPIEVRFDNRLAEKWTMMEIKGKDTLSFLYAVSNALSMRGIYIYKVHVKEIGLEVQDRLYVSDRQGKKIEGIKEQEVLKVAVALIKQFTHFLVRAPDPAQAVRRFDQLLDKLMEEGVSESAISFLSKKESLDRLARLFGTSDFLWEDFLRMQFENLLPILQDFKETDLLRPKDQLRQELRRLLATEQSLEGQKRILNGYKDQEMFRIDMKHLLETDGDLMAFSRALTELAEVVLDQAYEICNRHLTDRYGQPRLENEAACPFSICGLGKFGGREMGYASDIELLFVYGGPGRTDGVNPIQNGEYFERLCHEILHLIETQREGIFYIDLRLRPYGTAGALANPIDHLRSYYSPTGEAAPFERQALTKLRWVAGDEALGRQMEAHRDLFVYSDQHWDLSTALHLRGRQIRELVRPGTVNLKYSPGGVIDVEYAVQYLQIQYGSQHPELRTPSTLEALEGLYRVGIIPEEERDKLRQAYLFLRVLIDALRIVRGNARDLVLPDSQSEEFRFLARRLGYSDQDWEKGTMKLEADIRRHMQQAHHFFTRRFEKA